MSNPKIPIAFKFLREKARYKVAYGGRGGAKSRSFGAQLLIDAQDEPLLVLCAREVQNSIRDSVHALLANTIRANGWDDFYTILDTEIRGENGSKFIFSGLSRGVDSIKSIEDVDRVWVEEANVVSDRSWEILIPSIRKAGSEIWVSFNPDAKQDAAYQRFVVKRPCTRS